MSTNTRVSKDGQLEEEATLTAFLQLTTSCFPFAFSTFIDSISALLPSASNKLFSMSSIVMPSPFVRDSSLFCTGLPPCFLEEKSEVSTTMQ